MDNIYKFVHNLPINKFLKYTWKMHSLIVFELG
jgi:hypothetical protein